MFVKKMFKDINMYQNQFINFLRGLAALIVFTLHVSLTYTSVHKNAILPIFAFAPAWTGVWIFFIISGYLIGKGFWSGKYKVKTYKDFINFYAKRAIRILPIYFLIVFIDMFFIHTAMYFDGSETLTRVFSFRLRSPYGNSMIENLWFICTLIQLYILTPFIFKILNIFNKKYIKVFILGLAIFYYMVRHICFYNNIPWVTFIYVNWICNIDLYFIPFIFSIFCYEKKDSKLKKFLRPLSLVLLFTFLFINTIMVVKSTFGQTSMEFIRIECPTIILLITLLCLYAFDVESQYYGLGKNIKEKLKKLIKNPLLTINYLGIISFGFYCCHCQTIEKVCQINNATLNYSQVFGLSLVFTIIWGIIIYIFFEKKKYKNI